MATCATQGQAKKGGGNSRGHFGQDFSAIDLGVGVAAREMYGTATVKAAGDEQVSALARVLAACQLVAGQLLGNEAVVRHIPVQGADDIIAVTPGVRSLPVRFIAVGFGVANNI